MKIFILMGQILTYIKLEKNDIKIPCTKEKEDCVGDFLSFM